MKILSYVGGNKRVLDTGCATGYLAKRLKEKSCYVVGIEGDEKAAEVARQFCDEVIVSDVEKIENLPRYENFFDVIVYGDILEHLKRPDLVLMKFRRYLSSNGYVVASIPNVAYWRSRLNLLLGRFEYDDFPGIDKSHLRFFTLKTMKELFKNTGYKIAKIDYTGSASRLKLLRILPTLFVFQFIIIAKRSDKQYA
jgi:2-polyprenyl-3-methyl-5-hydroxy-6-metoxy-1,4-benzoquinol methylase